MQSIALHAPLLIVFGLHSPVTPPRCHRPRRRAVRSNIWRQKPARTYSRRTSNASAASSNASSDKLQYRIVSAQLLHPRPGGVQPAAPRRAFPVAIPLNNTPMTGTSFSALTVAALAQIVAADIQTRRMQQQIICCQQQIMYQAMHNRLQEEAARQRQRQLVEAAHREAALQRHDEGAWAAAFHSCQCCPCSSGDARGGPQHQGCLLTPAKRSAEGGGGAASPFSYLLGDGSPFTTWMFSELSPPRFSPKRLRF